MSDSVVIVAAKRTPIGGMNGQLVGLSSPQLASVAIKAAVAESGLKPEDITEALIGCVLPAALGQAPARQAVLGADLLKTTTCTTVNKVCGSGMKTTMLAYDSIMAGSASCMIAGGMESMSNAPHMLPKARQGYRYGHFKALDHMAFDGLENAYDGKSMGIFADATAAKYGFTREQQDAYAAESVKRAQAAVANGSFKAEIAGVTVKGKAGDVVLDTDEPPGQCKPEKIPTLKPAFNKDGTVTAASSSSISDGAAILILMKESEAKAKGIKAIARIAGHASNAHEPEWFTTAPVGAIDKLHKKLGWGPENVDLYEINEAFAVVTMAAMHDLKLPHAKVNVNGGACALGHPIGASGARLIVTLLHALKARGGKRGIASLCIGGGEATALAVEMM
ncbi:MAG: acetyl-CoA C-acyltransferase [Betaproteobacteria bacterium]|nr:acetyl-CoA C-acyltransferase [Betaproteobacteria bacterium]